MSHWYGWCWCWFWWCWWVWGWRWRWRWWCCTAAPLVGSGETGQCASGVRGGAAAVRNSAMTALWSTLWSGDAVHCSRLWAHSHYQCFVRCWQTTTWLTRVAVQHSCLLHWGAFNQLATKWLLFLSLSMTLTTVLAFNCYLNQAMQRCCAMCSVAQNKSLWLHLAPLSTGIYTETHTYFLVTCDLQSWQAEKCTRAQNVGKLYYSWCSWIVSIRLQSSSSTASATAAAASSLIVDFGFDHYVFLFSLSLFYHDERRLIANNDKSDHSVVHLQSCRWSWQ